MIFVEPILTEALIAALFSVDPMPATRDHESEGRFGDAEFVDPGNQWRSALKNFTRKQKIIELIKLTG